MGVTKQLPKNLSATGWCPGCGHGIVNRLIQEVLEEKNLIDKNIAILGVGCGTNMHRCVYGGNKVEAHHGRAPVTANAMKRILPDVLVWTYQGDGDAFAIGMGESVLAAQGDYPITVIQINNNNYGMTGGQTAQTTIPGQITTTSPKTGHNGIPFNFIPVLQGMDHIQYAARGTTSTAAEITKLKKYISKAFDVQMKYNKYSYVEVLSPCPTNWGKSASASAEWIMKEVVPYYPLGEFITKEV